MISCVGESLVAQRSSSFHINCGRTTFRLTNTMDAIGRNTAHRACFQNKERDGRYQVHYHTAPRSLDHAICTIEDVLGEALGLTPRQHSPG